MAVFLLVSASFSCGGGGGDGEVFSGKPIVVSGPITGFGSVHTGGIRFETGNSEVEIDGVSGVEDDLAVGMYIMLEGFVDPGGLTGRASIIVYDDDIKGPVASIDRANSRFTVLGQTVAIDAITVFDGTTFANLAVGNMVEVSGVFDGSGGLRATRVELESMAFQSGEDELEVRGIVSDLDVEAGTFRLGSLLVNYSAATFDDLPSGGLTDGLSVEVHASELPSDGVIAANRVEGEDDDRFEGSEHEFHLEGIVSTFDSIESFKIGDRRVTTNATTTYENGSSGDVGVGVKVEVEGRLDGSGTLVADKISIRSSTNVRIESMVEAVDAGSETLTLLGVTIHVSISAQFTDSSDVGLRALGLGGIGVGDWLEIRGHIDARGEVVAVRIDRDEVDDEVTIQGPVDSIARPNLEILGVNIATGGGTDFKNEADSPIGADEFFGRLAEGSLVKAKGILSSGSVLADEVEFED